MMRFDFGDIVLVQFPFTSQTEFKQRPAVVVSNQPYNDARPDIILMAVTSQLRPTATFGEVWINDWQSAGLLKPSAVKPVFATLEKSLILRPLGKLRKSDQDALRSMIKAVLA